MTTPLRVLILDDNPQDVELLLHELRRTGFAPEGPHVETEQDYLTHLHETLDVIFADYSMPQFSIPRALDLLHEQGLDIPFIVVTGTVTEQVVVETLQKGATDYLLKDRLTRLGQAVAHALSTKKLRNDKQQAEQALRESEARFRRLAENAQDIIYRYRVTPTQGVEYINPAVTAVTGYSPAEYYAQPGLLFSLIHPDDERLLEQLFDVETAMTPPTIMRWLHKEGHVIWVEQHSALLYNEAGGLIAIEGIARDITERMRAEAALAQERNLLRTLIDNLPDYIFVKDLEGRYLLSNVAHARGARVASPEELIGKRAVDFYPLDLVAQYEADDTTVIQSGDPLINVERWTVGPVGHRQWVLTTKVPLRDASQQLIGLVGISRDITERKQAEEALRQSDAAEREQRAFAEALRDIAATLTSTLDPQVVMTRILDNVGHVVPHDSADIMLIENEAAHVVAWRGYPAQVEPTLRTSRFPLTDWPVLSQMAVTAQPYMIPDTQSDPLWRDLPEGLEVRSYVAAPIRVHGQVIGFLNLHRLTPAFFVPVHRERLLAFADQAAIAIENAQLYDEIRRYAFDLERRVAERTDELRQAKEHVEAILDNNTDAIILLRPDGVIQQTNPAFYGLFGYGQGEAMEQGLSALFDPQYVEALRDAVHTVSRSNQSHRIELAGRRKDGTTFYADVALSPLITTMLVSIEQDKTQRLNTNASGIICSIRDITERKRLETELRAALDREKELSDLKSRFISMASHEFRTPLTTILSSIGLLELGMDKMPTERRLKHINNIQTAVRNMTQLLDDVLLIGKAEAGHLPFNPERLNLDEFCRDLVEEIQSNDGRSHTLDFSRQGDCGNAWGDKKLLRQIITNLLSNAVKYSPAGSQVRFILSCGDEQVVLSVQDEGLGIPEHDQKRLFETFHRAKNVGIIPGTGLGLAIAKKAVDLHGGTIHFESQVGKGTMFTVTLPTVWGAPPDDEEGS